MTRPSEENPDYVRFKNDQKQKKETIRHEEQKLERLRYWVKYSTETLARAHRRLAKDQDLLNKQIAKIQKMKDAR